MFSSVLHVVDSVTVSGVSVSPQSVPSPVPRDSDEVSISSEFDRKSKPFRASSVSGSSLVSILAGDDDDDDDEGFFRTI